MHRGEQKRDRHQRRGTPAIRWIVNTLHGGNPVQLIAVAFDGAMRPECPQHHGARCPYNTAVYRRGIVRHQDAVARKRLGTADFPGAEHALPRAHLRCFQHLEPIGGDEVAGKLGHLDPGTSPGISSPELSLLFEQGQAAQSFRCTIERNADREGLLAAADVLPGFSVRLYEVPIPGGFDQDFVVEDQPEGRLRVHGHRGCVQPWRDPCPVPWPSEGVRTSRPRQQGSTQSAQLPWLERSIASSDNRNSLQGLDQDEHPGFPLHAGEQFPYLRVVACRQHVRLVHCQCRSQL